ncbi:MAG: exo-alpha-sialidase [Gemmatimonadetes bacterium]|jgi:hypothetical protein|nr:exo-alpha-sialidase [Gemmatimonadota bacterium]MBT6147307.1 exo-alpha-sialidase [Gemmatimonadota bacterium]MBT7859616.1 exo-alpha-sialidase [Gemmatimonadota bacterium]
MRHIAQQETIILESPDPGRIYTCSPGICRLPSGRLVVADGLRGADSDDIPEPKHCPHPGQFWQGQVFLSDDGGRTWEGGRIRTIRVHYGESGVPCASNFAMAGRVADC